MKNKIVKYLIVFLFIFSLGFNRVLADTTNQPDIDVSDKTVNCYDLLGKNLTNVLSAGIDLIKIVAAIALIVSGMLDLIPAITSKDADALNKASKKLVKKAIILAIIFILPSLLRLVGNLLGFDISCII